MIFSYLTRLVKIALFLVIFCSTYAQGQAIGELSAFDRQLVKRFSKDLGSILDHKTGTLDRIVSNYEITGPRQFSASIDTIYTDYRKPAESKKYAFKSAIDLTKCNSDEITKIIYKSSEKRQVTVVKYKHGRRSSCITVAISQA